jgi:NAD(P)-dependent dehydrogenase (short-subunit alcohol dehydrogenase family)
MQTGELAGETAIVTGSGQNIGRAIAERIADEGANVIIADIDGDLATSTAEEIVDDGGEAMAVTVDVTSRSEVAQMVSTVEDTYGSIEILVNNVAFTEHTPFLELTSEEFQQVTEVNLLGTFQCTQEVARSMKETGGGCIVNVASTSAHMSRPTAIAYSTAKSGLLRFSKTAATALAEHDIRVNVLSPTRSGSPVGMEADRSDEPDDDILVGRWGTPEDQANAALFLVSSESDFVDGVELLVDGSALASR